MTTQNGQMLCFGLTGQCHGHLVHSAHAVQLIARFGPEQLDQEVLAVGAEQCLQEGRRLLHRRTDSSKLVGLR